jgi:chaperone BCS1
MVADLLDNPYFSAGFGLAALGFAAASAKSAAKISASLAQKRLISTLEIPSKDVAYPWLLHWLAQNTRHQNLHSLKSAPASSTKTNSFIRRVYSSFRPPPPDKLSVNTSFLKRENGSTETHFSIQPGIGSYFFNYKGAWFYVERSREKAMIDLKVRT